MKRLGAFIVCFLVSFGTFESAVACDRYVSTIAGPPDVGSPIGITTDDSGNVYVVDSYSLSKISPAGVVTVIASGFTDAVRVVMDSAGNFYVTQKNGNKLSKVTPSGTVSTVAALSSPMGLAIDKNDNLYVAVQGTAIKKITPAGVISTFAGLEGSAGYVNGAAATARFDGIMDMQFDPNGSLVLIENQNHTVRRVSASGNVTLIAGDPAVFGSVNGPVSTASFGSIWGVAVDPLGNIYVSEISTGTIREISYKGVVSTLAGIPYTSGSVDGWASAAKFSNPMGITSDSHGVLYVSNTLTSTVRRIE